jgi:hypothetical protein
MSSLPNNLVLLSLVLAFWIKILWAVITATRTLQRIATSFELSVKQKEERWGILKDQGGFPGSETSTPSLKS